MTTEHSGNRVDVRSGKGKNPNNLFRVSATNLEKARYLLESTGSQVQTVLKLRMLLPLVYHSPSPQFDETHYEVDYFLRLRRDEGNNLFLEPEIESYGVQKVKKTKTHTKIYIGEIVEGTLTYHYKDGHTESLNTTASMNYDRTPYTPVFKFTDPLTKELRSNALSSDVVSFDFTPTALEVYPSLGGRYDLTTQP